MTTFCPCMKSRGVFIQGFVLFSLFLAGWETEAAVFMASHTALSQTIESVGLKTSWVYS